MVSAHARRRAYRGPMISNLGLGGRDIQGWGSGRQKGWEGIGIGDGGKGGWKEMERKYADEKRGTDEKGKAQ